MTYAFWFDERSCSGCKACQIACQDKNNLALGIQWRRVYEITGGEWVQYGNAWENTVFAYNLSIACNHCVHPRCAGVCPVDAFHVRQDGIVLIDSKKCIGCGYCAWACPYDAPQFDPSSGAMTKCDLCHDYLDAQQSPACVAACPMRCLEIVEINDQGNYYQGDMKGFSLWNIPGAEHPFPLPKRSRTEPHLIINPHPATFQAAKGAQVSLCEEPTPTWSPTNANHELPLLIFTLLIQMAIGAFGFIFLVSWFTTNELLITQFVSIPLFTIGVILLLALLTSFIHLKKPHNPWRVTYHMRKSWLSREIFFTCSFAGSWTLLVTARIFMIDRPPIWFFLSVLTLACSLATWYSMQRVYQLRSVKNWNNVRTPIEFATSTLIVGILFVAVLLPSDTLVILISWIALIVILSLFVALFMTINAINPPNKKISSLRIGLIVAGLLAFASLLIQPSIIYKGVICLVFLVSLLEEAIGRWLFYSRRIPGI